MTFINIPHFNRSVFGHIDFLGLPPLNIEEVNSRTHEPTTACNLTENDNLERFIERRENEHKYLICHYIGLMVGSAQGNDVVGIILTIR